MTWWLYWWTIISSCMPAWPLSAAVASDSCCAMVFSSRYLYGLVDIDDSFDGVLVSSEHGRRPHHMRHGASEMVDGALESPKGTRFTRLQDFFNRENFLLGAYLPKSLLDAPFATSTTSESTFVAKHGMEVRAVCLKMPARCDAENGI